METIIKPTVTLLYEGKDITTDVREFLLSFTYTDNIEGESDEISLVLNDDKGLWRTDWYPGKGDTLTAIINYGDKSLQCGDFEIDELEFSGVPDIITIRALASGVKKEMRTPRSKAFEKVTLENIATRVAKAYSLTVVGPIEPITIKRVTQHRSKDLRFLHELALEYGYTFSVKGKQLVFVSFEKLEASGVIATIKREETVSYAFTDKMVDTFQEARVKYQSPQKNAVVTGKEVATGTDVRAGDAIEIRTKTEDETQAAAKARAALHQANSRQVEARVKLIGNPLITAGVNIQYDGFGKILSGKYHVLRSTHTVSNFGGYQTDVEVKKI